MLSEKRDSFSGLLKNKGLKEERKTTVGLDTIDTSTTLDSNKSHGCYADGLLVQADRHSWLATPTHISTSSVVVAIAWTSHAA